MPESIAERCKRHGSQGGKTATCVRCETEIQPYAGRRVAWLSEIYAHHPGQCPDADDRRALVRKLAQDDGALFAWRCDHIEPGTDRPGMCGITSTDRADYAAHARGHGATQLAPSVKPVKLRKGVPAAPRVAPIVPPFKRIEWTQDHYGEWKPPEDGGQPHWTTHHRGQFWSNGEAPHSVVVIEDMRAAGLPNRLVTLYLDGAGKLTPDWSAAKWSRREANRRSR
jgi:hypothetical protein